MKGPMPTHRPFRCTAAGVALLALLAVVMSGAGVAATPQSFTFTPTDDAETDATAPSAPRGSAAEGRVDGDPVRRAYLRFDVTGLAGSVSRATLRLYSRTAHSTGFEVRAAGADWTEAALTHDTAPAPSATITATSGSLAAGTWAAIDVTRLVTGNGTLAIALTTTSVTNLPLAMKESGTSLAPQLVVETSTSTPIPLTGDTSAPSAPAALTKTAATATQVSLSWSASTDNVGVTGYGVYRDGTLVGSATQTSYAVNGLSCGQSYTFAVDAVDAAGNRSAKTALTASTNACAAAPDTTAPTMPATLSKTGSSETSVSLSWSASTDNVGVTGYGVYRGGTLAGSTTGTAQTVAGLACGQTYVFAVDAYDAAGNRSTKNSLSASTSACAAPPSSGSSLSFPIRAAFYYPWFPETWTVGGVHVKYVPTLGYYSSSDAAVARAHVRQLEYGGIRAAIASWWGPGTHSESTRLPLLLDTTSALGSSLKWTLYHEQEGSATPSVAAIQSDLAYLSKYTSHPAFARVGGKPVIFVYNANDNTCEVADRWTQAAAGAWHVVLKVFPGYANCPNQPGSWHQYGPSSAALSHLPHSYAISAGFWLANEATPRLARDPARWQQNVKDMVASGARWQLVTTFNEWGEGTAIESAQNWASASGYGVYLDALNANGGSTPAPAPADTVAPTVPANVVATAVTTTSIALSWSASLDNVGVSGYGVYRDGALAGSTALTTHTLSGLACGKSYTFNVDAYDAAGNRSAKSLSLVVATSPCPTDLQPPTVPTSLRVVGTTATSVSVAWNASTDNVAVTGYRVYRGGAFVATTTSLTYAFGSLNCGTSYTFAVDAYDAAGNISSSRATLTAATAACPASSTDPVVAIAGDIAGDGSGDSATATLLDSLKPTAVLTAGDNVYNAGTASEFAAYYEPTWGRFKSLTYPAPGNHEYLTSGAAGYFGYFGARAGPSGKGFYSYNIGAWHLIALNSQIAYGATSEQVTWLKNDLAASGAKCVLAYWHKPRFSAGTYSDSTAYQPFWDVLYAANADVVVNAHDHNYQRFAPMTPTGARDSTRGIREFVVGTGGRSHYALRADSRREAGDSTSYGVLKLTLRAASYDWQFVPEAGRTFTDSGSGTCH
jgi:chitodextrinase